ncbi:hypothetical protein OHA27_15650 [Streptomyces sp. NBC_01619]|nr:hypothetical protein [Streptomyces sp. NBC_01619]MCX4511720.1 hypothetical protein [Streptomyces sp. NBC_01619]
MRTPTSTGGCGTRPSSRAPASTAFVARGGVLIRSPARTAQHEPNASAAASSTCPYPKTAPSIAPRPGTAIRATLRTSRRAALARWSAVGGTNWTMSPWGGLDGSGRCARRRRRGHERPHGDPVGSEEQQQPHGAVGGGEHRVAEDHDGSAVHPVRDHAAHRNQQCLREHRAGEDESDGEPVPAGSEHREGEHDIHETGAGGGHAATDDVAGEGRAP